MGSIKQPISKALSPRMLRERNILQATLEELARTDYGGLSVEQVAARAGVNKTTIYRRWPTKVELVQAAMTSLSEGMGPASSSGSLRTDLLQIARQVHFFLISIHGQGIIRLRLVGHPELNEIVKSIQRKRQEKLLQLVTEAITRGELPAHTDPWLVLEVLGGALWGRIFLRNEPVDEVYMTQVIDVILHGVLSSKS